jgi:hypothetical protein
MTRFALVAYRLRRSGWSLSRALLGGLLVVALGPSTALASPAPVDCSSLSLSQCYSAAKAAGWTSFQATPVGASCAADSSCDPFGSGETGLAPGSLYPSFATGGSCNGTPTVCEFSIVYVVADSYSGDPSGQGGWCGLSDPSAYCYGGGSFTAGTEPSFFVTDASVSTAAAFSIAPVTTGLVADLESHSSLILLTLGGLIALWLLVRFARKAIR